MTQLRMLKVCSTCGEAKTPDAFWHDKRKPDGLRARCIACEPKRVRERSEYNAAWREMHPDYNRDWQRAHPDKVNEYSRRWRESKRRR